MNRSILVLNGPAGVGKTTVSRCLTSALSGTVLIPGDTLRTFAPDNGREFLGPGSTYRAAASLAGAYLQMGALRVIFEYVFETPAQLGRFLRHAPAGVPTHVFTLWAPLDVVVAREEERADRGPLGARVLACYASMQQHLGALGTVMDTAGKTPEEVATLIRKAIEVPPSAAESRPGPP